MISALAWHAEHDEIAYNSYDKNAEIGAGRNTKYIFFNKNELAVDN